MPTIDHNEIMSRVFVCDDKGNTYSMPIDEMGNAQLQAGLPPDGFEAVFVMPGINAKYAHILASSLAMYQMIEHAKTLLVVHSDMLDSVGNANCATVAAEFQQMAANLNLVQRQAKEGLQAIVAQNEKYRR